MIHAKVIKIITIKNYYYIFRKCVLSLKKKKYKYLYTLLLLIHTITLYSVHTY